MVSTDQFAPCAAEYLWEWGHRNKDTHLFDELPTRVQHQLAIVKHDTLVSSLDIFRAVTPLCTVAVIKRLTNRLSLPKEYVIVQNQAGHEMFMISRGRVQVTELNRKLEEIPVAQIGEGSFFGEGALLTNSKRHSQWR